MMVDHATNVYVDNAKIVPHFSNSDGVDLCGLTGG